MLRVANKASSDKGERYPLHILSRSSNKTVCGVYANPNHYYHFETRSVRPGPGICKRCVQKEVR